MLKRSGHQARDIKAVAVSAGPGSYTGLRIGTSTAKGLCYALDIPLIDIDTLAAMSHGMSRYYKDSLLCPMIDARRMEVYCQVVDSGMEVIEPTQAKIIDDSSYSELLKEHKVVFFGNGSDKCRQVITHDNAHFVSNIIPSAVPLGELAWHKFMSEHFEDVAYFEPEYLKEYQVIKPKKLIL